MISLTFYDLGAIVTMIMVGIFAAIVGPLTGTMMAIMTITYIMINLVFNALFLHAPPKK